MEYCFSDYLHEETVMTSPHWEARIGRRVRIRDLHVLLTVVQLGSMAKAAHRLAITQPAVSKSIADLEHTLGVRLLDRSSQGVEPTAYGSVLVRRGLAVFDELRQGIDEIQFIANPAVGQVRIGCNDSLAVALLPAIIERLSNEHPGVTLHVVQTNRPITAEIRQLRERTVDLIIGRGVFAVPEGDLCAEILFEEPLVVVANADSQWARRRKIELAELMQEKWIMYPPEEAPGTLVQEAFRNHGLQMPQGRVATSSFHLRDILLTSGDYLTVVPACMLHVFNAKRPTVKRLPIDLGVATRSVAIFTLKNRTLAPVAKLFIDCAGKVARSISRRSWSGRA
jgi:DNA-binding transcriptional LysR family regulator